MQQKTLMVQGTTSDAGKSILVAGLCRVLARKGYNVVPFKPQNMALNSAVTKDGGEIGRAQALQAEACYLEPHTDMNPVLLKPSSDTGAQVIIHGKVISNLDARAFHDYKLTAMQAVLTSHQRISSQYDYVIVEGAGSPAEINLRDKDIANMGFAEAVDCPVILVADIDRGGVFAHLVGTLALLTPSEKERIVGFVINKFRGDISLLQPGIDWLEQHTGKPVIGVLPYLHGLHLDAEDAINNDQIIGDSSSPLKIIVPVLPRISNHTDFDALRIHPQVDLQFVSLQKPIPPADLIILPGSKNVRGDLNALREYGWQGVIARHLRYGGKVLGICGGYQMLGQQVDDPLGIEMKAGSSSGLGLLDVTTELQQHKQLHRVHGTLQLGVEGEPGVTVEGYEIHCGITTGEGLDNVVVKLSDGRVDGALSADGQVMGTYLHGLFEHGEACQAILRWAGLNTQLTVDSRDVRATQLNRLADCIERHLNLCMLFPGLKMQRLAR